MDEVNYTPEDFATEEWRPIANYPGYEVSNLGRIRSFRYTRTRTHKSLASTPIIMRNIISKDNRLHVGLYADRKFKHLKVHRIVLETFIGPCPSGYEACHNDGNCQNNRCENLRWDTHQSNMRDAVILNEMTKGEDSPFAKLTKEKVIEIRNLFHSGEEYRRIADIYGVAVGTIQNIVWGRSWKNTGGPIQKEYRRKFAHK